MYLQPDWWGEVTPRLVTGEGPETYRQLMLLLCGLVERGMALELPEADTIDPLSFVSCLMAIEDDGARDQALASVQEAFGLWVCEELDYSGLLRPTGKPWLFEQATDEALETLASLADKAAVAADTHAFGIMPNVQRLEFLDALESALSIGGANLVAISAALYLMRPDTYLPLEGYVNDFLTDTEGLGIAPVDLPTTARDYLELLIFLTKGMQGGSLPYQDVAQLVRAAEEGRTLAQGLTMRDRKALVNRAARPMLKRLYPQDPERVESEVARLLREG